MLLTEKSREEEKLSFKEQILRDLERVKEQDRREKEVEIPNLTLVLQLLQILNQKHQQKS